jgi:hypothetical protein
VSTRSQPLETSAAADTRARALSSSTRNTAAEEDDSYPWRHYGWLARLLGIPETRQPRSK